MLSAARHPPAAAQSAGVSPFDLDDEAAYQRWREIKLARQPRSTEDISVDVRDPRALSRSERGALLDCIVRANTAIYRSPVRDDDATLPQQLGAQLGLHRLDANWLAGEQGVSAITVSDASDGRGGFIPYTARAIGWHTDGYYHPDERRIHAMLLHCVRAAARGGINQVLDPERVYIALRDASPAHVQALMRPDAMRIPARDDEQGVARAEQGGPVFSVAENGCLHMRYTARTRSIAWAEDAATQAALACLQGLLDQGCEGAVINLQLDAGSGLVGHNVLHARSAFEDDPAAPRLLYRARFLDRVGDTPSTPATEAAWRNG